MRIFDSGQKVSEIKSTLPRNTENTYKYVVYEVLFLVKLHALIHNFSSGVLPNPLQENLKTNPTETNRVKI